MDTMPEGKNSNVICDQGMWIKLLQIKVIIGIVRIYLDMYKLAPDLVWDE